MGFSKPISEQKNLSAIACYAPSSGEKARQYLS